MDNRGRLTKQLVVALGIVEHGDTFLVTRRVDPVPMWHHVWELPGGKIKPGETPLAAVRREVREETGLRIRQPQLIGVHTHHWQLPDHTQQTFLIVFRCRSSSTAVRLLPDANDAYRWVTLAEFYQLENIIGANLDLIRQLYQPLVRPA